MRYRWFLNLTVSACLAGIIPEHIAEGKPQWNALRFKHKYFHKNLPLTAGFFMLSYTVNQLKFVTKSL